MNAQVKSTDVVATKTTTALAVVTASIAEINTFEQGVAELEKLYKGVVFDVRTKKGMDAAKEARAEIRKPRYALQNIEKSAKKVLNGLKDAVTDQSAALLERIEATEDPIHEQIKNEEDRILNEALERERIEKARVQALEDRLETIRLMPFDANGLDSKTVRAVLDEARAIEIGDDWQEYREKATGAKIATVAALEGMVSKAEAAEAEAARIVRERAELEQLRAEAAKRDAAERERQRIENERIAAAQRAEADRLAAEREELDRQEHERQTAAKAEQDRLDAERREFAAEQERQESANKERMRIEAVGFRAHFLRYSETQRDQLRALSDSMPTVDVFTLSLPEPEPEVVLTSDPVKASHALDLPPPPKVDRPTDAELVQCVAEVYCVEIDTATEWLEGFGK